MRIVITGGSGFIGRNLRLRLRELGYSDVALFAHRNFDGGNTQCLVGADFVFHLAGVNRPIEVSEFEVGNATFTRKLVDRLRAANRAIPVVFASSTQALLSNPYGMSKRVAEEALESYAMETGSSVYIYRLTNVFGKWAAPRHNSVVATFCDQLVRGEPLSVHDPNAALDLVYIDDVVDSFVSQLSKSLPSGYQSISPVFHSTVGEVAEALRAFAESRKSLVTARVGVGLTRALYSTYLSYLPPESFSYCAPVHCDSRGEFVEVLKTPDCGQFSYFTAKPGVTRGEHYHHSKTEKFMVIRGVARFAFRHIESGEKYEITIQGGEGRLIESIPGWIHSVSNTGSDELIIMIWANEQYDRRRPDTIAVKVRDE